MCCFSLVNLISGFVCVCVCDAAELCIDDSNRETIQLKSRTSRCMRFNAISWAHFFFQLPFFPLDFWFNVEHLHISHLLVIFITWNYLAISKLIQRNDVQISWNILTISVSICIHSLWWSLIDSHASDQA